MKTKDKKKEAAMNQAIEEIDSFLKLDEDKRIVTAKKAVAVLGDFLSKRGFSNQEALRFFLYVIKLFVSADKVCGESERVMFNKILGLDEVGNTEVGYEDFFKLTNGGYSESFITQMDQIIDSMPQEVKKATCIIGLAIICADQQADEEERAIYIRILE